MAHENKQKLLSTAASIKQMCFQQTIITKRNRLFASRSTYLVGGVAQW